MARRRRKGLGSSAGKHTAEAEAAAREIERAAKRTVTMSRNKQCISATMAYADMQRAIGTFEAHQKSGGKGWKPQTSIQEAALAFTDRCVRESGTLTGRRRRRR